VIPQRLAPYVLLAAPAAAHMHGGALYVNLIQCPSETATVRQCHRTVRKRQQMSVETKHKSCARLGVCSRRNGKHIQKSQRTGQYQLSNVQHSPVAVAVASLPSAQWTMCYRCS
jgi:hypothetical protein